MIIPALALSFLLVCERQIVDDADWRSVSPQGAGFEALFPAEPKTNSHTIKPLPNHEVTVHLTSASIRGGKALFLVAYHDLDFDASDDDKIRDVLEGGMKGTLLNALGKLTKHERISLDQYPGRHFEYAGNRFDQKIQAACRIFLIERRVYQITVIHAPEIDVAAETTKFFDSFKLVPAEATPIDPFSTDEQAPAESAPAEKPIGAGK